MVIEFEANVTLTIGRSVSELITCEQRADVSPRCRRGSGGERDERADSGRGGAAGQLSAEPSLPPLRSKIGKRI